MDFRLQDLGLTSLVISSLHGSLQEKFGLSDDDLPVSVFFEGGLQVSDLIKRVLGGQTDCAIAEKNTFAIDNVSSEVINLISEEVGQEVDQDTLLEDLGLTSLVISPLHGSLQEKFGLSDIDIPVTLFFEGGLKISDLVERALSAGDKRVLSGCQACALAANNDDNIFDSQAQAKVQPQVRIPFSQPTFDSFVACALQIVAIATQAAFMAATIFPSIFVFLLLQDKLDGWSLLPILPFLVHIHALTAGALLVIMKWVLVGRQRVGHTAVWSIQFAARWIVKKSAELTWTYSLWGLGGGTEMMNILHRLLGCHVGNGASIEPGCIVDYDLVGVGEGTSIGENTTIETSTVSLGVQTLSSTKIGRGCSIRAECFIERASTIGDGVTLDIGTLVPPFSALQQNSSYEGKPAELVNIGDIETGDELSSDKASLPLESERAKGFLSLYDLARAFTVFLLAPYLWMIEFSALVLIGTSLYNKLGVLGVAGLCWVPPTCVWVVLVLFTISAKKLLLGRVQPGSWPKGGSFHARKYLVDHLIEDHQLRWKQFSKNSGSFLAGSLLLEIQILKWLGVRIGTDSTVYNVDQCWTKYDLLSIGSRVATAGFVQLKTWTTTGDSLVGSLIAIEDDCFLGAGSVIVGPATLSKNCSVASYSVAKGKVEDGQTVVGCRAYQSVVQEENGADMGNILIREVGSMMGLVAVWFGMGLFLWILSLIFSEVSSPGDRMTNAVLALCTACSIGFLFVILAPAYFILMMWVAKASIIGTFTATEFPNKSLDIIPRYIFGPNFLQQYCLYTAQFFGGTMIEKLQWSSLGANIGSNVHLDSIFLFEPDLVSIGDWTSISYSALTTHQVDRRAHRYSPVRIGNRCTIARRCNVQLTTLEDDTDLVGLSMPLTGARLKSGTWAGYPAKKLGVAFQPPRPPRATWISLLLSPWSTFLGCLWFLTFPITMMLCSSGNGGRTGPGSLPSAHMEGTFENEDAQLNLSFESVEWHESIRILKLPAGSYIKGSGWWWKTASYEFDLSTTDQYVGRVILGGWWNVPKSFLTATLRRDGREWAWSHSWFTGDATPEDTIRFVFSDSSSKTPEHTGGSSGIFQA